MCLNVQRRPHHLFWLPGTEQTFNCSKSGDSICTIGLCILIVCVLHCYNTYTLFVYY